MSDQLTVPLGLLRRYLTFHGWRRSEHVAATGAALEGHSYADTFFRERSNGQRNVDVYILREEGLEDIELAVPRTLESRDAARRVAGAIETLSQLEARDRLQIITDVRAIGFDVVKSRVPDDLVFDDTIHLNQAVNYTANIKKLLAASATTELRPDLYYGRVKKEAAQYADQCRFGHTFKGSFGFTIESPVTPNEEPAFPGMEQQPPFERRVVQRIARGIGVIRDAVRGQDPGIVVGGYEAGFSANMCDEFADLIEQTAPSGMGFGFAFSPEWPTQPIAELWVGPQHVEMSRVAAKSMRERPTMQPVDVSGRIVRLQNQADPQDLLDQTHEREIILYWKGEEFGEMNVRMSLAPPEYLAAAEAHLQGHEVRAHGRLERRGRVWWLVEVTNFST